MNSFCLTILVCSKQIGRALIYKKRQFCKQPNWTGNMTQCWVKYVGHTNRINPHATLLQWQGKLWQVVHVNIHHTKISVDLHSQHLSCLNVTTQNLQIYHPMTPTVQTTSVIKNCTVTSGNNKWNFHTWNTAMKTCEPVNLRLKFHKLQNNFLPYLSILSVVYHSEWCLGVNVNGSRYITSTSICVCVCVCVSVIAGKWTGLKLSLCGLSQLRISATYSMKKCLTSMMSTSIALEKTTNVFLAACKSVKSVAYEKHEISLLQTMLRRLAVATWSSCTLTLMVSPRMLLNTLSSSPKMWFAMAGNCDTYITQETTRNYRILRTTVFVVHQSII